jgi:hypothetical protein
MTQIEALAKYAARASFSDLSAESRKQLPIHILDSLGCCIEGPVTTPRIDAPSYAASQHTVGSTGRFRFALGQLQIVQRSRTVVRTHLVAGRSFCHSHALLHPLAILFRCVQMV